MNQKVNLLNANLSKSGQLESDFLSDTTFGKFVITFAGRDDLILTFNEVSNTEWIQSFNTGTGESDSGGVTELSKMSQIGFSGIQYGPVAPPVTAQYNYNTTPGQPHNEILVSRQKNYMGSGVDAYVVYDQGYEAAIAFEPAGTLATQVEVRYGANIDDPRKIGGGLTTTSQDGLTSVTSSPRVPNYVYTMDSDTPHVTAHPINGEPVEYFKLKKETPSITLTVGVPEEA